MNLSFRNKVSYTYTLPYYALAHAAGGSLESFRPTIDQYGARLPNTFDYLLAKAVAEASEKRFDKARDLLWQAFVQRPETGPRPIPTGLQLLETIEALYELTRDERYRPLLADFAKRLSTVWPTAYAYAFDAKYTGDANQRTRALALALHLDRGSAHVSHFDAAERQRAQHWLEQNRPKGMKSSARAP